MAINNPWDWVFKNEEGSLRDMLSDFGTSIDLSNPNSMPRDVFQGVGQILPEVTAGLPQTGSNVGGGVGHLAYEGLSGIGGGIGGGLFGGNPAYNNQGIFGTSGSLGGTIGDLGKPLLIGGAILVGLLVVLMLVNRRTNTVQPIVVTGAK